MRHRSMGVLLACSSLWPAGAWAEVALAVVSTAPTRAHLVAPGTATTFVVSARNTAGTPAAVSLTIEVVSGAPGARYPVYPFQGDHGSSSSADVILAASGPGIRPGVYATPASLADIAPTLYHLWGVAAPANVDGRVLAEIVDR